MINTPESLVSALIDLYSSARNTRFQNPLVGRGRNHSVSGDFEDLFAHYLSNCMGTSYSFRVDQPITVLEANLNTQYPDILISEHGVTSHLVDLKMDTGWNREGLENFASIKHALMDKFKQKKFKYNEIEGNVKVSKPGTFAEDVTYHIVIATTVNGAKNLADVAKGIQKKYSNIKTYLLTEKFHPNEYGYSKEALLEKIQINHDEFIRLIKNITT
jgi:hypothetical protein